MKKKKILLMTITKDSFDFQTFRSGGKGGQHQNKTDSRVRCIHKESEAKSESRKYKEQIKNKKEAFIKCTNTAKFQKWLKIEIVRHMKHETPEEWIERMMDPENLKIEIRENDMWKQVNSKGNM